MTTQNISIAAVHVVSQYNDASKTLVGAWRTGSHRLLGGAASRYSDFLGKRELPLMNDDAKAKLRGAEEKVSRFLAERIDAGSARIVALMDRFAADATSGIESVANTVARVEAPLGNSVLELLDRANQPVAQISVKIADAFAAGAKKIEGRVAGTTTTVEMGKTQKAKSGSTARRTLRTTPAAQKA